MNVTQIWQRLSKREKTLVACALAVLVLVLVRYLLIGPFLERREWVRTQLEIQPELLERNIRYLGRKEEIEGALEKARAELKALEPSLLGGDTAPVSASNLQETVQSLAAREGTQVVTTRVLNPEAAGLFIKIPIQLEISGQLDQLVNLIRGIEAADKLLGMSEVNIRSIFTPAAARSQSGPVAAMQNLRVSLTITGFNRSQPAAPLQPDRGGAEGARSGAPAQGEARSLPAKAPAGAVQQPR